MDLAQYSSAQGYRFAFVFVDYATRFPEAGPLHDLGKERSAGTVSISWKDILTDQGTFMSRTLCKLYGILGVKSI